MPLRIYLAGKLQVRWDGGVVYGRDFPARQGRRAFAYLVAARGQATPMDELAEAVFQGTPRGWEGSLSALISKLRRLLTPASAYVKAVSGAYELTLPDAAWIDIEAAGSAIDEAEGALRRGDMAAAGGPAVVAAIISRRPLMPAEEGEWLDRERRRLRETRLRALDCLADVFLASGDLTGAGQLAVESIELEPYRETSYQRLIKAQTALGNRAEALRVYERCRRLLADDLGADPSPETDAIYLEALRRE